MGAHAGEIKQNVQPPVTIGDQASEHALGLVPFAVQVSLAAQ